MSFGRLGISRAVSLGRPRLGAGGVTVGPLAAGLGACVVVALALACVVVVLALALGLDVVDVVLALALGRDVVVVVALALAWVGRARLGAVVVERFLVGALAMVKC